MLIVDEVQTGVVSTGFWWAHEAWGSYTCTFHIPHSTFHIPRKSTFQRLLSRGLTDCTDELQGLGFELHAPLYRCNWIR